MLIIGSHVGYKKDSGLVGSVKEALSYRANTFMFYTGAPQNTVRSSIDLNNVKYINDNYGHEEGDDLIIKAAGVLVNTQLENSEIIRTDGNEFLIYLVGYSERQVSTYVKKLGKEMKNLPHEFGAAIGYSMITDEIKTLDDAINEATLEMITAKEEMK